LTSKFEHALRTGTDDRRLVYCCTRNKRDVRTRLLVLHLQAWQGAQEWLKTTWTKSHCWW